MICHFLIGVPGSGKSTLATQLAKLGDYRIISTDAIRQKLYGDATIQGEWSQIEENAICEMMQAIAQGHQIIYDATNAKRVWRMGLLMKLNSAISPNPHWMAWYVQTPIAICKAWNQKRDRQVPDTIIERMYASLQNFPPIAAEGFAAVKQVDVYSPDFDVAQILNQIQLLPQSLNNHLTFHPYSRLLDFERLMYLISLIIRYPEIGNLQATHPSILEGIFGDVPEFTSALEEITVIIGKLYGNIYADAQAIASDLRWLQQNSLININNIPASAVFPISSPHTPISISSPHAYSDLANFQRLIAIIRFILQHPFLPSSEPGSLQTLVSALRDNGIVDGDGLDNVRKDIDRVLKPYKILPDFQLDIGSKDSQYEIGDRLGDKSNM